LSPGFIKLYTVRVWRGVEIHNIKLHTFLILALDSDKWYASWHSYFALSMDWIGAWASLRGCFDALKM
jgi:hypothetical protein